MTPRRKSLFRWFGTIALLTLVFFFQEERSSTPTTPVQLYASICNDDLRTAFLSAIARAHSSLDVTIYSLTDPKIIEALNRQAAAGIEVRIRHDPSTSQFGFHSLSHLVNCSPLKVSGLMHQKILIVDDKEVWIGSANWTTSSLKLHDNLVTSLQSREFARTLLASKEHHHFSLAGQRFEYWDFPRDRKPGYERLHQLLRGAEKSIRVAMYTWTHLGLADALIAAKERGVEVEVILDRGQAKGVGKKVTAALESAGIKLWVSGGGRLLHHKFAWIDEKILINGSANWTQSAFSRNRDCFLVLHDLTEDQLKKIERTWRRTRAIGTPKAEITVKPWPIFRWEFHFEPLNRAA